MPAGGWCTRAEVLSTPQADVHPRSLHSLPSAWAAGRAFDDYGDGAKVLEGEEAREEAVDRVRYFLEACDAPQGARFRGSRNWLCTWLHLGAPPYMECTPSALSAKMHASQHCKFALWQFHCSSPITATPPWPRAALQDSRRWWTDPRGGRG
jgi:hypothetical protein